MPTVLLLQKRPTLSPDQLKALLRTTAKDLKQADALGRGQGLLDLKQASGASIPAVTTQPYPTATGLGSLEAARGTIHILDGDLELVGEQDSFGDPWDGRRWSENSWTGTSWNGGAWNGRTWSASSTTSTRRTCWGGRIACSATPADPCCPWICEASTPTAQVQWASSDRAVPRLSTSATTAQLDIQALEGAASLVDSGLFLAEQAQVDGVGVGGLQELAALTMRPADPSMPCRPVGFHWDGHRLAACSSKGAAAVPGRCAGV
jgi:hypothetical protein